MQIQENVDDLYCLISGAREVRSKMEAAMEVTFTAHSGRTRKIMWQDDLISENKPQYGSVLTKDVKDFIPY